MPFDKESLNSVLLNVVHKPELFVSDLLPITSAVLAIKCFIEVTLNLTYLTDETVLCRSKAE